MRYPTFGNKYLSKNIPLSLPKQPVSFGFLLDIESSGEGMRWYDFIVDREHLFIRNIYSEKELKKKKIHKNYLQLPSMF